MRGLAVAQSPQPVGDSVATSNPARFQRLSADGIDPTVVENPVVRMLVGEDPALASGRRCSIVPEDEWLIFLD